MKPKVSCGDTFFARNNYYSYAPPFTPGGKPGEADWVRNFTIGIGAAAEETTGMERILLDCG